MIVQTSSGPVRGVAVDGVRRFLGIRYAAAPFGDNRFALPQPVPATDETFDATRFGPTPPQAPYQGPLSTVLPSVRIEGADILNLNIWAPATPGSHPVLVWIYGGALTRGSNAIATYDGRAFARDGVVLVVPNYRLGAEGFSVLDDAPTNLGLADQFAALRWVRDNIAAFGGDPGRVTVFGQSAGGASVAALLAQPAASSLLAGAIVQSGPLTALSRAKARRITARMARDLGIAPTRAAFGAIPPEELVACQHRVSTGYPLRGPGVGFGFAIGDELVPADPGPALLDGAGAGVPVLVGATVEEYRLWFAPSGLVDSITNTQLLAARLKLGIPGRAARLYRRHRPATTPGEILGLLATDKLLRGPNNELADRRLARGGRTWMYEFAWPSPVFGLGAAHGTELGFVFDRLDTSDAKQLAGPDRPQELADAMHSAWVRFARTGDPGWPGWDQRRPVMRFAAPESTVVFAPRDDERTALHRR